MEMQIKEYAKRLKLSWIPANYHTVEAKTNEEYLLKIFEHEVQHRDERKINLLMKQATLPKIPDKPFDWKDHSIRTRGYKRIYFRGKIYRKARKPHLLWWCRNRENVPFHPHSSQYDKKAR